MTAVVAASVVLLLTLAPVVARWLAYRDEVNVSNAYVESTGGRLKARGAQRLTLGGLDGEVARTELRLREVVLVSLAAYDRLAVGYLQGRPPRTVAEIVREVDPTTLNDVGLAPLADASGFASPRHQLFVRYHVERRGVEVLSLPASREDGPALLMRLPEVDRSDVPQGRLRYFVANRLDNFAIPPPFALAPRVQAGGWDSAFLDAQPPPDTSTGSLVEWARESLAESPAR